MGTTDVARQIIGTRTWKLEIVKILEQTQAGAVKDIYNAVGENFDTLKIGPNN